LTKKSKKSKQDKNAGIEKHKQALREKKMKKKEKKKVTIPANYRKNSSSKTKFSFTLKTGGSRETSPMVSAHNKLLSSELYFEKRSHVIC